MCNDPLVCQYSLCYSLYIESLLTIYYVMSISLHIKTDRHQNRQTSFLHIKTDRHHCTSKHREFCFPTHTFASSRHSRCVGCEKTDMTSYIGITDILHLQPHAAHWVLEARYVGCENTDMTSYIWITDTLHLQLHTAQQALEAEYVGCENTEIQTWRHGTSFIRLSISSIDKEIGVFVKRAL